MPVEYGPRVVTDGLVLALDAADKNSLNIPLQSDHGYAEWYCFATGGAYYSIINETGGIIYEKSGSTITPIVTATGPNRGGITVTAGRTYYGSVPINLVVEDQHNYIAPLTMAGKQFWCSTVRVNPSTYYVYSPYQTATVNFYDGSPTGLAGTPTSTITVTAGSVGTFTPNTLTYHWISSDVPVIATASQTGADKTILSPMSTYVYQRYQAYYSTTNNTAPTTLNSYVTYDSTYKVMNMTIADGSGGDCAQGLGLEYLADTYSWGNVLSDYTIVFPYTATVVTSYWNGSAWVVWDTHSNIAGSITNPPRVTRDGTNGPGVEASAINGAVTNMASGATLWKWEGTAPFYLCINDSADDEFSVLGWNRSTNTTPRSGNIITDITGQGNNGTLTNGPTYTSGNSGSLVFDGINNYIINSSTTSLPTGNSSRTIQFWLYPKGDTNSIIQLGTGGGGNQIYLVQYYNLSGTVYLFTDGVNGGNNLSISGTQLPTLNTWNHITFGNSGQNWFYYLNGVSQASGTWGTTINTIGQKYIIGKRDDYLPTPGNVNGNIAQVSIYNRALTAAEIQQNFNALRGRFGI